MNRRDFIVYTAAGVVVLPLVGCRPWMRPDESAETPTDHQRATLAAMVATFLPGTGGTPGAADCGALEAVLEPELKVAPYVSEVVSDLDDWCFVRHGGNRFVDLSAAMREQALEERMGLRGGIIQSLYTPVYAGILAITKLAFYGGLTSPVGMSYIGFPGESAGYAADSAAGAYHAAGPTVQVDGAGRVSQLRVTVVSEGERAQGTLVAPDGSRHQLGGELRHQALASVVGLPAAGRWAIDVGKAPLRFWSFTLRTDLDDDAGRA